MQFEGEHLWIGQIGHILVLLAFVSSLIASVAYGFSTFNRDTEQQKRWLRFARASFYGQSLAVLGIFLSIFYICANHYFEYLYAYKHTSKELEFKYLLASIWEDQGGSFLLWSIWHCILGVYLTRKADSFEAPVMGVVSLAQMFLAMMIMGVYIFGTKIGNSPFVLTRNEIAGPIFSRPNYLEFLQDGIGLNVLLRNYWMVIHPPVLFFGFAATLVPFAYAVAGLATKRYTEWVKPAIPYTLAAAGILGVGIMMGGKWAYESLSFGGYWAWDPVENASLVPWMILVAGLHTMVIFKATGHSLKASYLFALLSFIFVLYSTFLTRTGILGDTSVHAFTEAGAAMNILILGFLSFFTIGGLTLFATRWKKLPVETKEEPAQSREFWMFIGSLVMFLSSLFIIIKTSLPVINKIAGTNLAPPEDIEFSYNKVMVLVAILIGILTAVGQYFKYKTASGDLLKRIVWPTLIASVFTGVMAVIYPITYYKQGAGFLGAIYLAFFAAVYAVVANAWYIRSGLRGNWKAAGGSMTHLGFSLMVAGIILSSGNKEVISRENYKAFSIPMGIDPLTKQQDNAAENVNLIRQVPNRMGDYSITYLNDSAGHEKGRRFFQLQFERKDEKTKEIRESFVLSPDVYLMKDNNMSSNPDIRGYLSHDVFTYISYAMDPSKNVDTAQFRISEVNEGDTLFYSKGFMVLNKIIKNPTENKFKVTPKGPSVMLDFLVQSNDSMKYRATPMLMIDSLNITQVDDTVYAQNLYVRFAGITEDQKKLKVGVKESDTLIDFVTIKAYVFPWIKAVWVGLILMAIGFVMSVLYRTKITGWKAISWISATAIAMIYMFLFAGN
jgi:cytochrome c-type biogenesis protein CcmF